MTEEQKQALIERCEQKIKELSKIDVGIMHTDMLDLLIYCKAIAALTAQPIKLPDNMPCKGAPQYIWLQVGCDTGNTSEWPEDSDAGVTWHTEQVHSDDVLYVRANNDEVQE